MPPKVPLILPLLLLFPAFGTSFFALLHCCRTNFSSPKRAGGRKILGNRKPLSCQSYDPTPGNLPLRQPQQSCAAPGLTSLRAVNSISWFGPASTPSWKVFLLGWKHAHFLQPLIFIFCITSKPPFFAGPCSSACLCFFRSLCISLFLAIFGFCLTSSPKLVSLSITGS